MRRSLAPLRARDFRFLFLGRITSIAGQQNIPQEKLSRVYSYDALGSFVLIPLGLVAAGPLAETVGADETLWLAAATIGLAVLAMLAVRDVRTLERRPASVT